MLKFEAEITDNFKKIYGIGKQIETLLLDPESMDDSGAEKILSLYRERKPYFSKVSDLISADRNGDKKIGADLETWQKKLKPLLEQEARLEELLKDSLVNLQEKLRTSVQGKSLLLYSKGKIK